MSEWHWRAWEDNPKPVAFHSIGAAALFEHDKRLYLKQTFGSGAILLATGHREDFEPKDLVIEVRHAEYRP